jgi:hypothetical protein
MRPVRARSSFLILSLASICVGAVVSFGAACTVGPSGPKEPAADASPADAVPVSLPEPDAQTACAPYGAPGVCTTVGACAAMADHSSYPGYCPGPADIQCCIQTPNVADNPPTPDGYMLMQQASVTTEMTNWAVMILNDPAHYPMFSTTTRVFGTLTVLARVEWHPPDFQNSAIHRGVTLYQPIGT